MNKILKVEQIQKSVMNVANIDIANINLVFYSFGWIVSVEYLVLNFNYHPLIKKLCVTYKIFLETHFYRNKNVDNFKFDNMKK